VRKKTVRKKTVRKKTVRKKTVRKKTVRKKTEPNNTCKRGYQFMDDRKIDQNIEANAAKILLVDDQPTNLKLLRQTLEPAGYSILAAADGLRTLELARRACPDLILLDVMMPEMDGYQTCQKLKEDPATAAIPVIFITARTDTASVVQGFETGAVDYLAKPFQREEVLIRVATHLRVDRLARQLAAANKRIREASRRKSRFLASMAHELRTPMNAIVGFTRRVQRKSKDILPQQQRDNLDKVLTSSDHLLSLIDEILDLSKIEAGQMTVHPAVFDPRQLVEDCCDTLRPLVGPEVELCHQVAPTIGQAHTDASRLRQIIINLVGNALKFTAAGSVRVGIEAEGTNNDVSLVITVADTGSGITAADLGTIFEEFCQVESVDRNKKGTGLGLSITKSLTQLLGGTIAVESEEGRGSTFTVSIPAVYSGTGRH
jgi:signal transduction histidine kinase